MDWADNKIHLKILLYFCDIIFLLKLVKHQDSCLSDFFFHKGPSHLFSGVGAGGVWGGGGGGGVNVSVKIQFLCISFENNKCR